MIFDDKKQCYLLDNMNNASKGYLSFFNDIPKTTICSLNDIYELVLLDYNYLTSPSKLMEYSQKYFEEDLKKKKISEIKIFEFKNE